MNRFLLRQYFLITIPWHLLQKLASDYYSDTPTKVTFSLARRYSAAWFFVYSNCVLQMDCLLATVVRSVYVVFRAGSISSRLGLWTANFSFFDHGSSASDAEVQSSFCGIQQPSFRSSSNCTCGELFVGCRSLCGVFVNVRWVLLVFWYSTARNELLSTDL